LGILLPPWVLGESPIYDKNDFFLSIYFLKKIAEGLIHFAECKAVVICITALHSEHGYLTIM